MSSDNLKSALYYGPEKEAGDKILLLRIPADAGYVMTLAKKPVFNEHGEIVGFERGTLTIEMPGDATVEVLGA
jgi:hypothetical protein